VYDKVIAAIGKPFPDEAWRADVVMLDHQGAHGPSLIWIRTNALRQAQGASAAGSGRIRSRLRAHQRSLSAATPTAIVRIQTNVWLLRQTDAIVTVTTTKTIIREHETDLVVREARTVADGVVVLTLADPRGAELPAWTPGAHIDLILGADLTRQYSLCSSPSKPDVWRVGVLRAPDSRGGSERVHAALTPGSTVRVRGPRNHFPLVASSRYLFIAGGIGITPILPMIAEVEAAGADWQLFYGGRERASMAFVDELASYGDRVAIVPQNEMGMLDLNSVLGTPRPDMLVYCCGPEGLLSAVEKFCENWPLGALHLERFSAKPQEPAAEADSSFELVLERSGLTLQVPPDKSVLEVIRAAGVSVLASCLEGVCGTCETEVIDGDVDHRDSVLNEEEQAANEYMMVCVSRCRSPRLTLDL
jgi:ferredoxin-NADP reductase